MRRPVSSVLVGLLLLLVSASVLALGLGRVRAPNFLGDPLIFTVALLAQPGDPVMPECIVADVYSGESRIPDELVRISVNRSADGTPVLLRVVTATRIDEPLARVDLSLQCGISIRRSYVVFVDPPPLDLASTNRFAEASSVAEPVRARRGSAASGSPRRASRQASTRRSEAADVASSGSSSVARSARRQPTAQSTAARKSRATAAASARPDTGGSSLKLESAPVVRTGVSPVAGPASPAASASPGAGPSGAPAADASASSAVSGLLGELAAKADADAQAANVEKLRTMEQDLIRLRNDNDALKRNSAELQTRLHEAEQDRLSNPLIYGLLAALLLLLVAVVALLFRQAALRREAQWLQAAAEAPPPAPPAAVRSIVHPSTPAAGRPGAEAAAAAAAAVVAGTATAAGPRPALDSPAVADAAAPAVLADDVELPTVHGSTSSASPYERTEIQDTPKEVSVDELIDLEQQADFFEVLGQDDAAIDLLMGQLQGAGAPSPLPYLKLLEIHRRRDERAAYDRVRERFNQRFNVFAPEWDVHSGHGRMLQDYPDVIARLQRNWGTPILAMNMMTELLFKRHESGETFDLPAYGELLFLYSVARDLAEGEALASGVDLLLPLGAGEAEGGAGSAVRSEPATPAGATADARTAEEAAHLADLPPSLAESERPAGVPRATASAADTGDSLPALDFDLPELGLRKDLAEPKGPLTKE